MPDYLLPCECGKKSVVSTAQAGQTIHCACGAALQVPTMRTLGQLEAADAPAGRAANHGANWEDRHRGAFLLVSASLACLVVAGYLWLTLPELLPLPPQLSKQEIADAFDNATPAETLQFYESMSAGLEETPYDPNAKPRRMMLWGIGIVVALAIVLDAAALAVVLRRSRRRR